MAGGTAALGHGLSSEELTDLNLVLCDVLRPADEQWGPGSVEADGAVVFDIRAPPATRCAMLRDLGWPEGTQPTVADLVAHILDRLEYRCAYDLAHEEGAAGRALGGDTSDTGSEDGDDWAAAQRWFYSLQDGGGSDGDERAGQLGRHEQWWQQQQQQQQSDRSVCDDVSDTNPLGPAPPVESFHIIAGALPLDQGSSSSSSSSRRGLEQPGSSTAQALLPPDDLDEARALWAPQVRGLRGQTTARYEAPQTQQPEQPGSSASHALLPPAPPP